MFDLRCFVCGLCCLTYCLVNVTVFALLIGWFCVTLLLCLCCVLVCVSPLFGLTLCVTA